MPKKIRKTKLRMVRLLTDIRYKIKGGSKIYTIGDTFELPEKEAIAEEAAGRVEEVVDDNDGVQ